MTDFRIEKTRTDGEITTIGDSNYLKLDCSNDPLTAELNITGSIEFLGNYFIRWRDSGDTTTYCYLKSTVAGVGGGTILSTVGVPLSIQYGAVGSLVAASLDTSGSWVFNYEATDSDFSIYKQTAGVAYVYNAGDDDHTFSGYATFNDGWNAQDDSTMKAGKKLIFDGT